MGNQTQAKKPTPKPTTTSTSSSKHGNYQNTPSSSMSAHPDAHARPPDDLRLQYKRYQKAPLPLLDQDAHLFDAQRGSLAGCLECNFTQHLPLETDHVYSHFLGSPCTASTNRRQSPKVYEHPDVPGLFILPSLLPQHVQLSLLDKLLHRDLSHPSHKTNLHMHYDIAYPRQPDGSPSSFFSDQARSLIHSPKDSSVHKPMAMSSCLNRKMRWVTLGGQYDWTQKVYPSTPPPPFPEDVASLVQGLFPSMKAQAAIVNLYTPTDTLSMHRDVSEECGRPLVSISLGCDGIFVAGLEDGPGIAVRLRSGDAVVMSGRARYAWHGVPQIVAGTCPGWMADWPYRGDGQDGETYEHWKGWMARKRINLNVRQMWDDAQGSTKLG